jgi:DNA sulfur modification protein DndC
MSQSTVARPEIVATDADKLSATRTALRKLYEADARPWVVAYSGGKDSTAVLQLVFELLLGEKREGGKPVYVISSDTRVEPPNVAAYLSVTLDAIENAARKNDLPLNTQMVSPEPEESFWFKLIGLGYPSPTRWFRWCTSSMKIKPSRRVIERIAQEYGSVILLLGTRSSESSNRGNAIAARSTNERGLNPHHEIPNALVATPIVGWTTDDVWEYLYSHDPPWGGSHDFMLSLYRQANGGECPLVLDLDTPSCGGSRFGCWTCTVVKEDKSMQGFIRSGEENFLPLNEFRDWLKQIREDISRRSPLRRDGKSAGPGPFNPATRQEILERLLHLERKTGLELVSDEELRAIQGAWSKEFDYSQSVWKLATRYDRRLVMDKQILSCSENPDFLLEECSRDNDFPVELAMSLLDTAKNQYADLARWGAKAELERAIGDLIEKNIRQAQQADPNHDL